MTITGQVFDFDQLYFALYGKGTVDPVLNKNEPLIPTKQALWSMTKSHDLHSCNDINLSVKTSQAYKLNVTSPPRTVLNYVSVKNLSTKLM